jgi:Zn-dependent protease
MFKMKLSQTEKHELLKAWIAISLAFAILQVGGLSLQPAFFFIFLISGLTVGLGFLVHELSHKLVAQRYRCWAEFRANDQMLIIAVIMSFFGFIFIAPGAVVISGHVNAEKNGRISAAGPLSSIILSLLFLAVRSVSPIQIITTIAHYGFFINSWLALFNLLPFFFFDGAKIMRWNKVVYGIMIVTAAVLVFLI